MSDAPQYRDRLGYTWTDQGDGTATTTMKGKDGEATERKTLDELNHGPYFAPLTPVN